MEQMNTLYSSYHQIVPPHHEYSLSRFFSPPSSSFLPYKITSPLPLFYTREDPAKGDKNYVKSSLVNKVRSRKTDHDELFCTKLPRSLQYFPSPMINEDKSEEEEEEEGEAIKGMTFRWKFQGSFFFFNLRC